MDILVFSWKDRFHPWAGGSEVNLHEQAARWIERGHRVTLFTSRPNGSRRVEDVDGMRIYRAGRRYATFLLAPLYYLAFLRKGADVVLDIINGVPFCSPLFSRRPVVALIHHVHRDMFVLELGQALGSVGKAIERYVIPLVYRDNKVICVSRSTAGAIRRLLYRGDRLDVEVVYNGVDLAMYCPDSCEKLDRPTVLYLGRLKPYKQLPRLIRIMAEVKERVPTAELLIAGAGEGILEAEHEVKRCDAEEYVRFLWQVSDREKVELYRRTWITATASQIEGWGLTVIEANACGTPAIAFDVPGLNESIVHDDNGMLARDDAEFVEHLVRVLTDEGLRRRLAERAIEWSNRFSWDATAGQTLDILEGAINREIPRSRP